MLLHHYSFVIENLNNQFLIYDFKRNFNKHFIHNIIKFKTINNPPIIKRIKIVIALHVFFPT